MNRDDVRRVVLVAILLAPLVAFQAGPGYAPAWLSSRIAGVPLTVWATVAWFAVMMLLTWRFAVLANNVADKEAR